MMVSLTFPGIVAAHWHSYGSTNSYSIHPASWQGWRDQLLMKSRLLLSALVTAWYGNNSCYMAGAVREDRDKVFV